MAPGESVSGVWLPAVGARYVGEEIQLLRVSAGGQTGGDRRVQAGDREPGGGVWGGGDILPCTQ